MSMTPPGFEEMKARAKATRRETGMSHGHALDFVAKSFGFKDWNAVSALLSKPKPARPIKKIKNRVLFQIVLEYRMEDCLIAQFQVLQKLSRDHRNSTFDQAYLDEIMALNVIEMMERAQIPVRRLLLKFMMTEFGAQWFNPLIKRDINEQEAIRRKFRRLINSQEIMWGDRS